MWTIRQEILKSHDGTRFTVEYDARPCSYLGVLTGWQSEAEFRQMFNSSLADSQYNAFRWETPSATNETIRLPFECVLLNSPELERQPNPDSFGDYFNSTNESIVTFPNLGGDATLIVPRPEVEHSAYGHLAAFVRCGTKTQCQSFWRSIALAMFQRMSSKPVWLNTAGAGVPWLHVRLDDSPKYYRYEPYRKIRPKPFFSV